MALILIRGENNSKILNAIADIERHANLNVVSKPKIIDSDFADNLVEKILNAKLRTKSDVATAFMTKEDTTFSIMQIKKIHPPAHVVIVSDEYEGYKDLMNKLNNAEELTGYYSHKSKESGMKDYKSKTYGSKMNNQKVAINK
ncbi:DUF356 domain-containing protein [Methanobrevibacter sp. DSM 116169]|uniref:DUF356 domain-containing protein n=1 Tax=Methanobrevibacter sp. DSM 116169 TaxID=3242727 RepID=UPI0038FC39BD